MKRVVITGLGAVTPIGNNIASYLEGLQSGKSGANLITRFDPEQFKTQFACEVTDLEFGPHLDPKAARRMDLFTQYAMISTGEAMEDAGLDLEKIDLDRAGVIWGSGIGGLGTLEAEVETFAKGSGTPRYNPFMIVKMIADIAAGHISIKYGFRGVNYGTVSACASASNAIANAVDYIRLGRGDIAISGGSEAAITRTGIGG